MQLVEDDQSGFDIEQLENKENNNIYSLLSTI